MSLPKTTGTAIFLKAGRSMSISSLKPTMARSLFGTSIPTACLPGIGATIRTLEAAKRSAMLSPRATILLSLTPGAGRISNIVTTGPLRIPVTSASILNSLSVSFKASAERLVSLSMSQYSPPGYSLSKPFVGTLYDFPLCFFFGTRSAETGLSGSEESASSSSAASSSVSMASALSISSSPSITSKSNGLLKNSASPAFSNNSGSFKPPRESALSSTPTSLLSPLSSAAASSASITSAMSSS